MAVYKVPQDVEADDKLIGPFSFRQFVYLLIAAGLVALAVGLFQIFPLLAILPLPPVLLFLALALPIKKDQPMETYLAALVSYYIKPRTRKWTPGQRESTILITAPKIVEDVRTRDISEEEATHRLSFLADIVDSQGYAIKGATNNNMRDDLVGEANATADMFDNYRAGRLSAAVERNAEDRHAEIIRNMRAAIEKNESRLFGEAGVVKDTDVMRDGKINAMNPLTGGGVVTEALQKTGQSESGRAQDANEKVSQKRQNDSIIELANNTDFTVATIEKEANRIKRKDEGEVFISLH